ncbi:MAG: exodeoxyribonuclease III [Deltaproteobacteria bacterium]|nr:exodeoxyribonuclease III [Deltaproteobacteria bacterium]
MKIASFNTNSLRARLPIIKNWLHEEQPDILALQETKVQDKDFPFNDFIEMGYLAIIRGQKSYNGVALIARREPVNIRKDLYEEGDEQARFISADFSGITIINVYVPQGFAPGTDKFEYKLKWLNDLLVYIQRTYSPEDQVLILGDFNVAMDERDVYDPEGLKGSAGFHPDEQEILSRFFKWGFVDIFRKHNQAADQYTFWDYRIPNALKRNKGWRIDYIAATQPLAEKSRSIVVDIKPRTLEKPSDHTFIVAEFDL